MYKLIVITFLVIGLFGCSGDKIHTSDVDVLIENQIKSNEEIISQMNSFIDKHGKEGFEVSYEIVKGFVKKHEEVKKFNAAVDKIEKNRLAQASREFVEHTFSGLSIEHPLTVTLNERTPRSLIKLQIVNLENLYLRERGGQIRFSFNNFELVVIPDKIKFQKGEKITGAISLMGYSDELKRPMKMNGAEIEMSEGKGFFSVDPADLKEGQRSLRAEMLFPDTTFTGVLKLE